MGGACCVAARDRTIRNGPRSEGVHRNSRCSPLWSVRWDNRGRVAGEDTSQGWLSDVISRNDASDIKSMTDVSAHASDRGSPLENHRMGIWRKGTVNDENVQRTKTSASGQSVYTNSAEVNASTESPLVSGPASLNLSPSVLSLPSVATSPFSSQSHMLPPNSTPSRGGHYSPGNRLSSQESETLSSGRTSPITNPISEERRSSYVQPTGSDESTRRSQGRSSDGWSLNEFSELLPSSHRERERCSFGSQSYNFTHDKSIGSIGHCSRSVSFDLQTCGVCSKALTDRAAYSSHNIFANNELAAVAVLICGHVYHAECLETVTPEISKYDPACPVCTFGKKQVRRLTGKALKAEKEMNSRSSKKSRIPLSTTDDGSLEFDYWKSSHSTSYKGKDVKLTSSPSLKDTSGKPFIRRHFSFGLKGSKSNPDSHTTIKKGPFWAKSSKQ